MEKISDSFSGPHPSKRAASESNRPEELEAYEFFDDGGKALIFRDFKCRVGCGACCIAPSISSAIPGMPEGKPAGIRCVNLDDHKQCRIWGRPEYPAVCRNFLPAPGVCGQSQDEAMARITVLEKLTAPT